MCGNSGLCPFTALFTCSAVLLKVRGESWQLSCLHKGWVGLHTFNYQNHSRSKCSSKSTPPRNLQLQWWRQNLVSTSIGRKLFEERRAKGRVAWHIFLVLLHKSLEIFRAVLFLISQTVKLPCRAYLVPQNPGQRQWGNEEDTGTQTHVHWSLNQVGLSNATATSQPGSSHVY